MSEMNSKNIEEKIPSDILVFNKEQIIRSDRYILNRDLLNVLLEENKQYSIKEVDDLISKFMKGKVN